MSEHIWAEKHIADYAAGELTPEDAKRFETHARDCPECAQAVDALQFGVGLEGLFTEVRPRPELEERAVVAFRAAPRTALYSRSSHKVLAVIAAILVLGTYGAMATNGLFEMSPREAFNFIGSSVGGGRDLAERERISMEEQHSSADEAHAFHAPRAPSERFNFDGQPQSAPVGKSDGSTTSSSTYSSNNAIIVTGSETTSTSKPSGGFGPGSGGQGGGFGGMGGGGGHRGPYLNTTPPTPQSAGQPGPDAVMIDQTLALPKPTTFLPGEFKPTLPPIEQKGDDQKPDPNKTPSPQPKGPPAENPGKDPGQTASPEPVRRIVIRSGEMEFELDSFDAATATITKLVTEVKGAFIATVNSEKLPNGRVKGSITVRIPPEHLDSLVLDLRKELGKGGELKGVRITSQDVTKQYTDLESRLRGARTMEGRLIQIIKEGKGEIKQLLEAERELGVWRTKIEEFEGELRYYANLAALSTLTITLTEKETRAAAMLTESERVQAGVEVEDVDKAYQQLLAAVVEAKGRVIKS
ncbi:MAG TPA: DUF4349 domain-containing protein, partial [Gemmata sp.]|nr:DUF4349 domain-containing protein [Gemmata sp.]